MCFEPVGAGRRLHDATMIKTRAVADSTRPAGASPGEASGPRTRRPRNGASCLRLPTLRRRRREPAASVRSWCRPTRRASMSRALSNLFVATSAAIEGALRCSRTSRSSRGNWSASSTTAFASRFVLASRSGVSTIRHAPSGQEPLGAGARALDYARQRKAFGAAISEYQGVSFPLAQAATELHAAHLMGLNAAMLIDQGDRAVKELSMAKAYSVQGRLPRRRPSDADVRRHGPRPTRSTRLCTPGKDLRIRPNIADGTNGNSRPHHRAAAAGGAISIPVDSYQVRDRA